jgi:hypothetical protein
MVECIPGNYLVINWLTTIAGQVQNRLSGSYLWQIFVEVYFFVITRPRALAVFKEDFFKNDN